MRHRTVTSETPSFDELKRGHVVVAVDSFTDRDRRRPYVVVNDESHPFDGEQYVGLALTTRTWHDARVPLDHEDFVVGQPPRPSSIVPHGVVSLDPNGIHGFVGRVRRRPLDRAAEALVDILGL